MAPPSINVGTFMTKEKFDKEGFKAAMQKLKASVHDSGRELQKVIEWNDKYGEVMSFTGNQKENIYNFLIKEEIYKKEDIIVTGA
jgi:hypothetical protein